MKMITPMGETITVMRKATMSMTNTMMKIKKITPMTKMMKRTPMKKKMKISPMIWTRT